VRAIERGERLPLARMEIRASDLIAEARHKAAQAASARDGVRERSPEIMLWHHIGGTRAEFAVGRALNLYPDLQVEEWGRPNLVLQDGRTIEVLWNRWHRALIVSEFNAQRRKPCDFYLVLYQNFIFSGWATHQEWHRAELRANHFGPRNGPCYLLAELHPTFEG
jgi:hypothetical protein